MRGRPARLLAELLVASFAGGNRMQPVDVFVAPRGNAFMRDIADWLVEAATASGRTARLITDRLPEPGGTTNIVVAPHEFFVLHGGSDEALLRAAAASVPLCTEQPGTPWYHLSLGFCRSSKAVLDINPHGVAALLADGVPAVRLALGGVPGMVAVGRPDGDIERDIDVLFLGGKTPRRSAELAAIGEVLWPMHSELRLFQFTRPVTPDTPGLVFGQDKYQLLARSRILLNIHRDGAKPGYFEWARMVEAMANGCVVVTEPSTGFAPLVSGVHFIETDDIPQTLSDLIADPRRCSEIGERAADAVLNELPLADSMGKVLDQLEAMPEVFRPLPRRSRRRLVRSHQPPLLQPFRPADLLRRRVYTALLGEQQLQRRIDRSRCLLRYGTDDHIVERVTGSYASAQPTVSVIVTLYNYGDLVAETLQSIVHSTGVAFEVVVVDDHSTDHGRSVVESFMDEHDDVPIKLLGSEINRGLAGSRNLAVSSVRAELVMIMDADNLLYPPCLDRLSAALVSDPAAAFAYATLEEFGVERGLRSAMGWHLPWLCDANYIDAQAMIRRSVFERHGGYKEHDDLVYGWEDYELWLRLAEAGEYGCHVAQILGRYRTQGVSMISMTNLIEPQMRARMKFLHPALPWPPE